MSENNNNIAMSCGTGGLKLSYDVDSSLQEYDVRIEPKVIWVTQFDENSAKEFAIDMHQAHLTGQTIIPIIIDSFGGDVYSLLSMISEVGASELPVATIVKGKAMSAGSFLASCGTPGYRYCDPESTYMIHEVNSMTWGRVNEIKADSDETTRLNNRLFRILADKCNQESNYFIDLIHEKKHADWYLTPSQAKKHNIVDHVRLPKMNIKIAVEWNLT